MRTDHDARRVSLEDFLNRRQRLPDAEIVCNDAVFNRNVQIRAQQDALSLDVDVVERSQPHYNLEPISFTRSTSRFEYPHSLSYQPSTFTWSPSAMVESPSRMHECGSPTMSLETIGSSVYRRIPFSGPAPAAFSNAEFTSSTVTVRPSTHTRSVMLPSGTGTR